MKHSILFLAAVLFVACQPADTAPEAAEEASQADEGWVVLFDGSSLDNFRGYGREDLPASWTIDGDALSFAPDSEDRGDIVTREQYGDFELSLEWRVSPAGNSGIIYRVSEEYGAPYETGPEYQILDNTAHPDAEQGEDRLAGSNYDMHGAPRDAVRPVGEWNTGRIVANGNHVEHWLNGQKVVEYELGSDDWNERRAASKWVNFPAYASVMSGHIAFQDHSDPVWYRNIRIRTLD